MRYKRVMQTFLIIIKIKKITLIGENYSLFDRAVLGDSIDITISTYAHLSKYNERLNLSLLILSLLIVINNKKIIVRRIRRRRSVSKKRAKYEGLVVLLILLLSLSISNSRCFLNGLITNLNYYGLLNRRKRDAYGVIIISISIGFLFIFTIFFSVSTISISI